MSLKVWLPLNGNLENIGCSDLIFTNTASSGITTNNTGKIGSCYYRASAKSTGRIESNTTITLNGDISMCCWAKVTATVGDTANGLISNHSHANNTGFGICVKQVSSTDYRISCSTGNGSNRTFYTYYGTSNIKDNWHHLALTYNNTTHIFQLWVDGIVEKTQSYTNSARADKIRLFDWSTTYDSNDYKPACFLNDIRIYDHCLSAAEVHEISQGLVLHYKLNGFNNSSVLPTGYQQLEYIEGTGTSYFDTGYKFNIETDACKVIFKGNDTSNTGMIFANNGTKYFWFYYYGSSGIRIYAHNGSSGQKGIAGISSDLNQHIMEFKNKTYYIDGVNKGSLTDTYTESSNNIWLFSYGGSSYPFKGRIYYVDIQKNGKYQRMFIPAKRLIDSAIGMYDLVTNTFYTSSNAAFTAGTAIGTLTIQDSSGYGHNGSITGNITINSSTPRYNSSTNFPDSACSIHIGNLSTIVPEGIFTFNIWFKKITGEWSSKTWETILGGPGGFEFEGKLAGSQNAYIHPYSWGGGSTSSPNSYSIAYTLDTWHMVTMVRTTANTQFYLDGELKVTGSAGSIPSGNYFIGAWNSATSQNYRGYFSDARIYCTALSAVDVKQLYEVGAKVDNLGNVHTFEYAETQNNILAKPEFARAGLLFQDGMSRVTQANCSVTLTSDGCRIYRPPNVMNSSNGGANNMWGGLKLVNQSTDTIAVYDATRDNIWGLQKGHTYLWAFHVYGQSTNVPNITMSNNMGWGGGGLSPSPTLVLRKNIPANFNGEQECFYIFTINDNITKPCTSAYSSYVKDSEYLSYRHFMVQYDYWNTGELGTDIYITDIRMYDITSQMGKITKYGQAQFHSFVEGLSKTQIRKGEELLANHIIEL